MTALWYKMKCLSAQPTYCASDSPELIMKYLVHIIVVLSCIVASMAMPYPMPYPFPDEPGYGHPAPAYGGAVGRVKIQAYRGPSEGKGYDTFAPWGFYVTQPKDNFYGYGHAPAGYH